MARTRREVSTEFEELKDKDKLSNLFALSMYCSRAFYPKKFEIGDNWADAICLTPAGRNARKFLNSDLSENLASRIIFMSFYHDELFVDYKRTDIDLLREAISAEIRDKRIVVPDRFGRSLYDKFNDSYLGRRLDELSPEQSESLLSGTAQGVYQVGNFVSGPLGIVISSERRYVPPSNGLPLWHCDDVGCQQVHDVEFNPFPCSPQSLLSSFENKLRETMGSASPWGFPLISSFDTFEGGKQFYDLIAFLGDCLLPGEVRALFRLALDGQHGDALRETLAVSSVYKNLKNKSRSIVSTELDLGSLKQTLFRLGDGILVQLLDAAVLQGSINFGVSESRSLRILPPRGGFQDTATEGSRLGMRSIRGNPRANLEILIFEAYRQTGQVEKLRWRLRGEDTVEVRHSINRYVSSRGPQEVVKSLLLIDAELSRFVENRFVGFVLSNDDQQNAERLVWRLGYTLRHYDDRLTRLDERLLAFSSVLTALNSVATEADRSSIRSVGVNLFVSIEEFLEELISFNIWYLSEDHHARTKFVYRYSDAMRRVNDVIVDDAIKEDAKWRSDGRNTLGGLLAYLDRTLSWMQSLPGNNQRDRKRPSDLPHYAGDGDRVFPYVHTQLWADADGQELSIYIGRFEKFVKLIRASKLAEIRNGLDHKRGKDDFPKLAEMLMCCRILRDALEDADRERIYPKIYWNTLKEISSDGMKRLEFRDRGGRPFELRGPSVVQPENSYDPDSPKIIGPGNLIGLPNAEIIFSVVEETEYQRLWEGYPRRSTAER